jgi:hypothetical protein
MTRLQHQLVRDFFAAPSTGSLSSRYFTDDMTMFRIRDGRIASMAEHFNPQIVREKIMPLLQAAQAQAPQTQL